MSSWEAISNYMSERQENRDMGQNDYIRMGEQGFVYTDRQPYELTEDQPDEYGLPGVITAGGGLDEELDTRPSLTQGPEDTLRDTARYETLEYFKEEFGWNTQKARDFAETLWGTSGDLSKTAFGIGVADLLPPVSAPLTMQEGIQTFGEGMETGSGTDMALGAVLTAAGALEAIPVMGVGFKMLNKAAQSEVVKEFITVAGDAFNRTGEITQDALIEAGEAAQARLESMMSGTTLSANPIGAVGDMAVVGAGKIASKFKTNVEEGLNKLADVGAVDDIKRRTLADLHERIPPETRVAKDHVPGERMEPVSGGRFTDLDLNAKGQGFNGTQDDLTQVWEESVRESGNIAEKTVARLEMSPRLLEFWDNALRLSDRGRYWYEVSTESFKDLLPDLSAEELKKFISVVASTSPVANPFQNMQRAVAAFSSYLRGVPIDNDLVIPRNVRDALVTGELEGLKTGSFGGTMQYIDGLTDIPPLSTNDRQVASSFAISGEDVANNPELYEVLSRFYTKLRDNLNAKLPPGAEPYETWQLQALGWIQERTLSGNPFNDDYLDALTKIDPGASVDRKSVLQLLEEGGVNVPEGILTREILEDPRVADILSPTTMPFREAPIATIEVNTVQTMAGARASDLLQKAVDQGNDVAVRTFNKMVTGALYKASRGKTSPFAPIISAVVGKRIKPSRIEVPTADRPFDVAGTYKGQMSPNIRVPLQGLSNDDINVVMAGMAKAWKQEGVPATRFTTALADSAPAEGSIRTYSVFIKTTDDVGGDNWLKFADALPEVNEISVRRVPNGYVLDIHPDYEKWVGPVSDAVEDAVFNSLGDLAKKASIMYRNVTPFSYETLAGADDTINVWKQRIRKDAIEKITAKSGIDADAASRFFNGDDGAIQKIASSKRKPIERIRALGQRRVSDFDKAVEQAQDLGGSLAEGQRKWAEQFGPGLEGSVKPKPVKSTPAVERFLAEPKGRPLPMTGSP
tara:strand:+ start:454 stop:3375 length:2922 start_codon:yes stop_codon:yes gene_type:complete